MAGGARRKQQVRAFENPVLERLSRIHPAWPLCLWVPVSAALIVIGAREGMPPLAIAAWVLAGVATWTLAEYALHRWVFHWVPSDPRLRRMFYPVHELHHDVQEWDRLVAPPLMSVPLFVLSLLLFRVVLGAPAAWPFLGGFTIGYLLYDYIHLYTHFVKPSTRIGKGLRRRHLQHHFACPDRWYGISSPLWDFVFRTHVPRGQKPARLH